MRTHRKYTPFLVWDDALLHDCAQLRHLISARLEPIVRGLRGGAFLDLVFEHGDRVSVVPFIEIVPEMLVQREMSPFVWPASAAKALGEAVTEELERALLPWIESLTLARQLNAQAYRAFGGADAAALVGSAREAGFLGAAPYARVIEDAAPYLYAGRFAGEASVAIRDRNGAFGEALLAKIAREIEVDLSDEQRTALARRWFGVRGKELSQNAGFDLAVYEHEAKAVDAGVRIVLDAPAGEERRVEVATSIPTDVLLSYDPQDAPAARSFAVHSDVRIPLRPVRLAHAPAPSGGSSGRILMLMREDYERAPDADTDEALALSSMLRAEGFSVEIASASRANAANYDLVHAFTLARVNELAPALNQARAAHVPIVISPYFQDVSAQGAWGTGISRALLRVSTDETDLEDNFALLSARRLEGPGLSAKRQEPFAGYDSLVRQTLAMAGCVLTAGDEEEAALRTFGYTGRLEHAFPCLIAEVEIPAQLPVQGDFVLVHAPVEARSNLLPLVRAATQARIPLLLAGPIVEPEYALALREQAGMQVTFLSEPDTATAQALNQRACVYADVAWVRFGTHRLLRAAGCGAALLTTGEPAVRGLVGGEFAWEADPASERSIAVGLADAWMHARAQPPTAEAAARRAAALGDPRAALVATVKAYAAAQTSPAVPS